jgi:hypothetical protein
MAWQDEPGAVEVRLSALTATECQSVLSGRSQLDVGERYSTLRISPEALANLVAQANDGLDIHSWLLAEIAMQTAPEPVGKWLAVVFRNLKGNRWPRRSRRGFRDWEEENERRGKLADFMLQDEKLNPSSSVSECLRRATRKLGAGFKTLEKDYYSAGFDRLMKSRRPPMHKAHKDILGLFVAGRTIAEISQLWHMPPEDVRRVVKHIKEAGCWPEGLRAR